MNQAFKLHPYWLHWFGFCLVAIAALLLVYGSSLQFFFWNEDFFILDFVSKESLREYTHLSFTKADHVMPLNIGSVFRPFSHYVYFKATSFFFHTNPLPYRLLLLGLYFLSALLVAVYARVISGRFLVGFIAGILFIISRIHFAPIHWISANNEILLICFALLSVLTYLWFLDKGKKQRVYYGLSLVTLVLALASKESAIVIPALIGLSILFRIDNESLRERLFSCLHLWPHGLIVLIFLGLRAPLILHSVSGRSSNYGVTNLVKLGRSYLWGFWWNLETFVEPYRAILDSITQSFSLFQPIYLSVMMIILSIAGALWLIRTKKRPDAGNPIWLGIIWFLISAFPALATGILEAYLFSLSAVGFAIALAYLAYFVIVTIFRESTIKQYLAIALFLTLSIISASLLVPSLQRTTWPVQYMPLTFEALEIAQTQLSSSDRVVCLVNFPSENWWVEEDLQAAFNLFVSSEIVVNKLYEVEPPIGECPPGATQLRYTGSQITLLRPLTAQEP